MSTQTARPNARERLTADLPVSERRLPLAGVSTALLQGGEGPPVVLLHGPSANATHWMRVLPELVEGNRVIAPDLPGHGASDPADAQAGSAALFAWLGQLIKQTCESPPVLVGHGLGGAIAARFAAADGDRIRGLVLVDTLGLAPFEPAPDFGAALQQYLADPSMQTHDALWQHCALDLDRMRDEIGERWTPFAAYNVDRARMSGHRPMLGRMMDEFGFPAIPGAELAAIRVPTSMIWGRQGLATSIALAERASDRFGWPLKVIEDCGDDPAVERPDEFIAALRPLLGDAAPSPEALEELSERLSGSVLLPADPRFGEATLLWNALIKRKPALALQPLETADVVAAVQFARDHGLPLGVRGGGHNVGGTALPEAGLTIDMSRLRQIEVDPDARTATVDPGCLLQDVDRETQRHGLATPLGFLSEVGVAGLTLGGGLGYLTRRFGWTVDNLLEAEIVTADGAVRRAAADENEDLFWAIRGAGANLGVATSFKFRLHEVGPSVFGGLIAWPFERAAEIQRAYRALTAEAPRELAVWMNFLRAPAAPFVPEGWHGERVCALAVCYSGDLDRVNEVIAPIRALADPVFDVLAERTYTQVQSYLDSTEPKGDHYYWRTHFLAELSDGLLATLRELAAECPMPRTQMGLLHVGGALNERDGDDGAVGNRDARYATGAIGMWEPNEPREQEFRDWIREAGARLAPFSTGGSYVNFQTADEGEARVRESYGANYDRLVEVKRRYDPDNLFRSNRNVRPELPATA